MEKPLQSPPPPGKFNLRTGTGWKAFFQIFSAPLVHMIFAWKNNKIVRTSDFSPSNFSGSLNSGSVNVEISQPEDLEFHNHNHSID